MEAPSANKGIFALIMFILAFFVVSNFGGVAGGSVSKFLLFFGSMVLLGAVVAIGGMANLNPAYALPILLLSIKSLSAVGVTIFCAGGLILGAGISSNLIKPKIGLVAKAAFGLPYLIMILIMCAALLSTITFQIPVAVEGMVVDLLGDTVISKMINCELSLTGAQCIDKLFSDLVDSQCGDDQLCRTLVEGTGRNSQIAALENQISQMMPTFEKEMTIRENTILWLDTEINSLLTPYQEYLNLAMTVFVFIGLQFMGNFFVPLSGILGGLILTVFMTLGLIEERKKKVDKITYLI
ncbi:MAG: hypothetical protein GOV00_00305 [Candidatus Altiarchaeota archaeon]|nr:hypothetical protein [Candidatus Altiarchaeota archaeon]